MNEHKLDAVFRDILAGMSAAGLSRTDRQVGQAVRRSQQQRMRAQKAPDDTPWAPRKRQIQRVQQGIKFLWQPPAAGSQPMVRELKNWKHGTGRHGPHITGYDINRGGLRTFYRADIEEYLEIRTRRVSQGNTVRARMFERLRRYVKILQADNESIRVGFNGDQARIARVHHFGLRDNVVPGVTTQYPARELLGLSVKDKAMIRETIIGSLKGGMK